MAKGKGSREDRWVKALEEQFLTAYQENADALFRHCLLRVRDREVARDIVQETFSRTWNYLAKGKEVTHIRAFLYRVANNLIVDGARKKKAVSLDAMIDIDGFEVRDEHVQDPTELSGIRNALKLLDSLDDIYRIAITMRYMDEMSPKEIALILGVSENVVSVRIHRGIERLSTLMNKEPPGPQVGL
jgi:RNA polymerase sigma-70 factor (ECF subfamily)